jgi:CMP-N-acetylneuraminic acid synthetase
MGEEASEVIGLVPARGGSKGIPGKNLALLAGRSLLTYPPEAAHGARTLGRIILSTDNANIAAEGERLGLEIPFMRPAALAADDTPMISVVKDALDRLDNPPGSTSALVLLQPTSPLRRAHHIDDAVELFRTSRAASVVSVVRVPHRYTPSSLLVDEGGRLRPYLNDRSNESRRQDKPVLFARNGPAVLVLSPDLIRSGRLYDATTVGFEMTSAESVDIDEPEDLRVAECLLG